MIRRYLAVVGVILLAVIALAVWLKPPLKQMRAGDLTFYCVGALKVTVCGDPN